MCNSLLSCSLHMGQYTICKCSFNLHSMWEGIGVNIDFDGSKEWLRFCRILCNSSISMSSIYRAIDKLSTKDLCYQQNTHTDRQIGNFH
jgi:hypothetical protein